MVSIEVCDCHLLVALSRWAACPWWNTCGLEGQTGSGNDISGTASSRGNQIVRKCQMSDCYNMPCRGVLPFLSPACIVLLTACTVALFLRMSNSLRIFCNQFTVVLRNMEICFLMLQMPILNVVNNKYSCHLPYCIVEPLRNFGTIVIFLNFY